MTTTGLRRAYREALKAHEGQLPAFPAPGSPLEALDAYEAALEVWRMEWLRLRAAARAPWPRLRPMRPEREGGR